jgi:hypothetical protein
MLAMCVDDTAASHHVSKSCGDLIAFSRVTAVGAAMERTVSQAMSPTVYPVRNVDGDTSRRKCGLMMGCIGSFLDDDGIGSVAGIVASITCHVLFKSSLATRKYY